MKNGFFRALACLCFLAAAAVFAPAQDLARFEQAVTEFTLDNGMHFIVLERHEAPVASFHTYAGVGSANDPAGRTGLAHMFEHMAFKGTPEIGSLDYEKEKKALAAVDRAHDALEAERRKGPRADPDKLERLEKEFQQAVEAADEWSDSAEFTRLIEQNGGTGLNATTSLDATRYFLSLPSNRAELWFYLESSRFLEPVFREFYKERDVVREERRQSVESNPVRKLIENFLAAAYQAHPYGRPGVGWASDIESLSVDDARRFFETYYAPGNLTVAIAGDLDPQQVRDWAEAYFGRLRRRPPPPRVTTREPEQEGERRIEVVSTAQPVLLLGYKKPSNRHPDRAVFEVISSVLSAGRTSWFYKELVRDRQIALAAGGFPDFPGAKYSSLFLFYAFPGAGHGVEENEQAMLELIEKLKEDGPDEEILQMVKAKARASLVRQLDSNAGLAAELARHHVQYGDWRQLFRSLDEIEAVTADDVRRVAREYFRPGKRTVAYIVRPQASQASKETASDD